MTQINAIIIDDERDSRELIGHYLTTKFIDIQVVAEAHSVKSGLERIQRHNPDLLFLDIHLPDGTGFDLLTQLGKVDLDVIFVTTYEQYAIDAFKHHAVGYVLKPIDQAALNCCIEKHLKKEAKQGNVKQLVNKLLTKLQTVQITLPTLTGFIVVNSEEIIRLESEGSYTKIFFENGKMVMTSRYLKEYEKILPATAFCRIHHSHVINLQWVKEYIKGRGGQVVLKDGTTLSVSQNRKKELLKFWL